MYKLLYCFTFGVEDEIMLLIVSGLVALDLFELKEFLNQSHSSVFFEDRKVLPV